MGDPLNSPSNKQLKKTYSTLIRKDSTRFHGSVHSYHEEEKMGLVEHINGLLQSDTYMPYLPMDPEGDDVFEHVKDGIFIPMLVNSIKPGILPTDRLVLRANPPGLNIFERSQNLNRAFLIARDQLKCQLVNVGAEDMIEGKAPHLVLAVLWQLVKVDLVSKVQEMVKTPRLIYLLQKKDSDRVITPSSSSSADAAKGKDETLTDAEKILLRWFNYHLEEAGHDRRVTNLSNDIKDCVNYIALLHQLSPEVCDRSAMEEPDLLARADLFLADCAKIDCNKFINSRDIITGNSRLNFAFLANLFNAYENFQLEEEEEEPSAATELRVVEVTEEVRIDEVTVEEVQVVELVEEVVVVEEAKPEEPSLAAQQAEEIQKIEKQVQQVETERASQREQYGSEVTQLLRRLEAVREAAAMPITTQALEKRIEAETEKIVTIQKEEEALKEEVERVSEAVKVRSAAVEKAREDLDKAEEEVVMAKKLYATDVAFMKKRVDETQQVTKLVKKQLQDTKVVNRDLAAKKVELVRTREEINEKLDKAMEDKRKIAATKRNVEKALAKAKQQFDTVYAQRVETEADIKKLVTDTAEIKEETKMIVKERVEIQSEVETLKEDVIDAQEELQEHVEHQKVLLAHQTALQGEVKALEDDLQSNEDARRRKIAALMQKQQKAKSKLQRDIEEDRADLEEERSNAFQDLIAVVGDTVEQRGAREALMVKKVLADKEIKEMTEVIDEEEAARKVADKAARATKSKVRTTDTAIAREELASKRVDQATKALERSKAQHVLAREQEEDRIQEMKRDVRAAEAEKSVVEERILREESDGKEVAAKVQALASDVAQKKAEVADEDKQRKAQEKAFREKHRKDVAEIRQRQEAQKREAAAQVEESRLEATRASDALEDQRVERELADREALQADRAVIKAQQDAQERKQSSEAAKDSAKRLEKALRQAKAVAAKNKQSAAAASVAVDATQLKTHTIVEGTAAETTGVNEDDARDLDDKVAKAQLEIDRRRIEHDKNLEEEHHQTMLEESDISRKAAKVGAEERRRLSEAFKDQERTAAAQHETAKRDLNQQAVDLEKQATILLSDIDLAREETRQLERKANQ
eukprot:TRINITY_DN2842_c0_g1_i1.p1 TRINITY_DN2842_c0_g1~~TRINITY_DN2842_c0_g1_i1.p1  ORF type:complete len:1100 (-),score=380.13 TRINITY_DN2842_c0_g1_i1:63-3362(-)